LIPDQLRNTAAAHDGAKYAEFTILRYRYSLLKFIAKLKKEKKRNGKQLNTAVYSYKFTKK